MADILKSVWNDIKDRKNLEIYLTLVAAIVVLIADVVGVDASNVIFKVILTVLAVLLYINLEHRKNIEEIENSVKKFQTTSVNFLNTWDDTNFKERIKTAESLSLLAIANHVFLSQNSEVLNKFVEKGELRAILVDPSGNVMKMVSNLSYGYEKEAKPMEDLIGLCINQMKDFYQISKEKKVSPPNVELKLVDHLPFAIITMIDHQSEEGVMYVTLNGFNQPSNTRPSFTLLKKEDSRWFSFYEESYENIWKEAKQVQLDK